MRTTFQITKSVPSESAPGTDEITFATDEIGDTPSSPLFATATPTAEKKAHYE